MAVRRPGTRVSDAAMRSAGACVRGGVSVAVLSHFGGGSRT